MGRSFALHVDNLGLMSGTAYEWPSEPTKTDRWADLDADTEHSESVASTQKYNINNKRKEKIHKFQKSCFVLAGPHTPFKPGREVSVQA